VESWATDFLSVSVASVAFTVSASAAVTACWRHDVTDVLARGRDRAVARQIPSRAELSAHDGSAASPDFANILVSIFFEYSFPARAPPEYGLGALLARPFSAWLFQSGFLIVRAGPEP